MDDDELAKVFDPEPPRLWDAERDVTDRFERRGSWSEGWTFTALESQSYVATAVHTTEAPLATSARCCKRKTDSN